MDSNLSVKSKQNKTTNPCKKFRLKFRRMKSIKISLKYKIFVAYVNLHIPLDITSFYVNAQKIKILEYVRTVLSSIQNRSTKEFIFKAVHLQN